MVFKSTDLAEAQSLASFWRADMDPFLLIDQAVDAYQSARAHHRMALNQSNPQKLIDARRELQRTARALHTIMDETTITRET